MFGVNETFVSLAFVSFNSHCIGMRNMISRSNYQTNATFVYLTLDLIENFPLVSKGPKSFLC